MPETGTIDRSSCPADVHGTLWAYSRRCRCPDAKRAKARYAKHYAAGILPPSRIDATGAKRRLRALQAIGYSLADLAARLGYTSEASFSRLFRLGGITRERHQRIAALYDELCMTPGPSRRSVLAARRKGWPPPLAWDDIDRDPDPPQTTPEDTERVDDAAVIRAMNGRPPRDLRRADRLEAVARLVAAGASSAEIADRLDTTVRTVDRDRRALKARTRMCGSLSTARHTSGAAPHRSHSEPVGSVPSVRKH